MPVENNDLFSSFVRKPVPKVRDLLPNPLIREAVLSYIGSSPKSDERHISEIDELTQVAEVLQIPEF